jgi:hypothetical protein
VGVKSDGNGLGWLVVDADESDDDDDDDWALLDVVATGILVEDVVTEDAVVRDGVADDNVVEDVVVKDAEDFSVTVEATVLGPKAELLLAYAGD